jgi:hypothetical protein
MASLFKRTSSIQDRTDSASVLSRKSTSSGRWKIGRILSRKSSDGSIRTEAADTTSVSSRRDHGTSLSRPGTPHAPRRKTTAPPSSFPGALKQPEKRSLNNGLYNVFDEERLSTTADIRQEIVAIEAELKRLMDAFTGLEITALSEAQRSRGHSITRSDTGRPSNAGSVMESKVIRRPNLAGDSDAGSIRSATSTGTGFTKSVHSARITLRAKSSVTNTLTPSGSSQPGSLRRKDSSSSIRSHGVGKGSGKAPTSGLPNHVFGVGQVNASNASLTKSGHHVMMSVPEDAVDVDMRSMTTMRMDDELEEDDGIEDIWRKREEVQMRYEARLDYLRAKLKSAQLHEKLLRK